MKKTKGRFTTDTFEKLEDLGRSTAKHVVRQTIDTFSPTNILEDLTTPSQTEKPNDKKDQEKKQNHSPIDIDSLKQEYDHQDKKKEINLKNRLFQLVKQGEEKELEKKKQKEKEDEQIELEEQKKKEQEKKEKEQKQQAPVPQGKIRRSIFSPKVKAKREHFEIRPSQGKQ
jgi:cation diffusion facilitator CzcD-associated flavoprotein CzcO